MDDVSEPIFVSRFMFLQCVTQLLDSQKNRNLLYTLAKINTGMSKCKNHKHMFGLLLLHLWLLKIYES